MSEVVQSHAVEGTETREEIEQLDEISASNSQASIRQNEVLLDIRDEALLKYLGRLEEELFTTESQENVVEIKCIPEIMRRNVNFAEYFGPRKWTIGPIHHDKFFNDEKKHKLAALFILKCGSTREVILKDFKNKMKDIRKCFDEVMIFKFEDDELMRLLFLDGCAILGFIYCYLNWELEVVGINDAQAGDIERDLLMLENQIPFQVLEVLIRSGKENLMKKCFLTFILVICWSTFPRHSHEDLYEYLDKYCFSQEINKNQKAVHLLDVFRAALLFNSPSFDLLGCMLTVIRGTFWILGSGLDGSSLQHPLQYPMDYSGSFCRYSGARVSGSSDFVHCESKKVKGIYTTKGRT